MLVFVSKSREISCEQDLYVNHQVSNPPIFDTSGNSGYDSRNHAEFRTIAKKGTK